MKHPLPIAITVAAALLSGCSTTVSYNPSYIRDSSAVNSPRYQGKLLVVTESSDDNYVFHGTPKSVTGMAMRMNAPLGKMTKEIAGEIYGHLFDSGYEFGRSPDSGDSHRFIAVIHPQIGDFSWRMNQAKNAGFAITPQVKMTLNVKLLEDAGRIAFERSYESGWVDGSSYVMSFTPVERVNEAIHKSMADLMRRSVYDLDAVLKTATTVNRARPRTPGQPSASGTGFFITEDGYVLSNAHVVKNAERVEIKFRGNALHATVVKTDPVNDIAILKVSGSFPALPLAGSNGVKLGDSVFTIGFPDTQLQVVEPKFTDGKISSLSGVQDDPRYFQISAPVQPGNSGGALVNARGEVIGIVSARLSDSIAFRASGMLPQNVNYSVRIAYATVLLDSVSDVASKLKHPDRNEKIMFEDIVMGLCS